MTDVLDRLRELPASRAPMGTRAPRRTGRIVAGLAGVGALVTLGGLLIDSSPLIGAGAATVALAAAWALVVAPEWLILGFVLVRPLLDIGPTYDRGPNVNAPAGALLILAIGSWIFQHRHELRRPAPSVLAAGAFAGAGVLSAVGSHDLFNSLDMAMRLVSVVALFFIAEQLGRGSTVHLRRIVMAVLGSAVLAGSVAIAQIVGLVELPGVATIDLDPQLQRPPGPYPAPTVMAAHLVIAFALLLLVVPRLWASSRWRALVPHAVAIGAMCLWVLAENKSRSPSTALVMVVAVFATVRWRWRGALVSLMVILAAVATLQSSAVRLNELGSGADNGANADTFEWRTNYWRDNLPRFTESPITGIGLGRVEELHAFHQPPHSTVVQTIVEMGIVGAIAYLAFALLLARDLVVGLRRSRGTPMFDVLLLVSLLCVGYAFMGLFENLLTQLVTSGPMALLTGAAIGATRRAATATAADDDLLEPAEVTGT